MNNGAGNNNNGGENTAPHFADDREAVLQSLRQSAAAKSEPPAPAWESAITDDEDVAALFLKNARANNAEAEFAADRQEAATAAAAMLAKNGAAEVVCASPLLADLAWGGVRAMHRAPTKDDRAGATFAAAAAADTGSLIITAQDSPFALSASLLPEIHIAFIARSRIAAGLSAAWRPFAGRPPRQVCVISGPSRTADIEQTLILGAHGPLAMHIFILENE